jgi:hypothetical protein
MEENKNFTCDECKGRINNEGKPIEEKVINYQLSFIDYIV